jgi:beta-lactamase regulating signal transducer with metallopeptidase domain
VIYDVYLPLLAAACFGWFGVRLANRMRPSHATWFLTVGSAIVGTAALGSLLLLGFTLVGQVGAIAAIGDWSASALGRRSPVAAAVAAIALAAVGLGLASAARVMIRRVRTIAMAHEACKRLPAVGGVVVTGDDDVAAYALPGRPGRVIVSAAALARLDPKEASALVAHEQSHLRHRHYLHQLTTAVVAATNPLLRGVSSATAYHIERWADEDAAAKVGVRETVAGALLRVAGPKAPLGAIRRAAAMRRPQSRTAPLAVLVGIAGLAAVLVVTAEAATDTAQLFRRSDPGSRSSQTQSHHTEVRQSTSRPLISTYARRAHRLA